MPKQATIYLDYAAATPVDDKVMAAMKPFFAQDFYNPSATYGAARSVAKSLALARSGVAHWLGARPSEITFTAGGSEANNLVIHGLMRQYPEANIVVSSIEHESVLDPAANYDSRQVAVKPDGRLDIDDLRSKIDDKTVLISIMYANNEVGTIQPIREIAKLVSEIKQGRGTKGLPLYLHTDACQAANYLDLHVARLGVDMMSVNGGKIYGPKQSGFLYVKAGIKLLPLIEGGGQERGLRAGTENVAAAVGLATALDLVQTDRHHEIDRLKKLQQEFLSAVEGLPETTINGSQKYRLPNNIHVTFGGQDNERLLIQLDEAGIMAAAGSACSASSQEPSHVLGALGLSKSAAQASLRFTMGRGTTQPMIGRTSQVLNGLLH
ncbi:MAG: cysteine desulfurase family protein [Patescibacteria group bacterium]